MNGVDGDFRVGGNLRIGGKLLPPLERDGLLQEDSVPFPTSLTDFRIYDTGQPLSATPASTALGLIAGAYATSNLYLSAGDLKAAGGTTRRARILATLPPEYVDGQTIVIRLSAGMKTTVADTSCLIAVEAYKVGRDTNVSGSNVVTTSAQSINSLTFADKTFAVDPSTLSAGDQLDIRVSITCTDAATLTAVIAAIAAMDLLLDIQG